MSHSITQDRSTVDLYTSLMKQRRYDIANTILDIIDGEKRFVEPVDWDEDEQGTVEELRMQLREGGCFCADLQ
jgi:hypothetical protein